MRTKRSNKTLFKFLYSYSKINFLSKSSQDSDMMQMQPNVGTLFRLGSDVLDKSRNVTQKCVIVKISLHLEDGTECKKR